MKPDRVWSTSSLPLLPSVTYRPLTELDVPAVWKPVMWVTTRMSGHCEIIYSQPTADPVNLAGVSLQSGVLGLDTVSHENWLPGVQLGNGL